MHGISTFPTEVTHVSKYGLWLLLDDEELFLSFLDFPWFKAATIEQLCALERPTANHIYWPALDIDLSVESIRSPSSFPLVSTVKQHVPSPKTVRPE